jgi:EmrB/QacA subfamily drug resistance transporter
VTEGFADAPAVSMSGGVLSPRRIRIIITALMLAMFLASIDQTIVSTALPTIVGELGGGADLSWVVTAYLLTATVSTPLWGKLGDLYGRKSFFQASIVIFLVGSILSGFSHSMLELIVFRAFQGLGAGGLMVGAQTILGDIVSPRERGRYSGLFGAVFGVATIIGPLIGGVLVEYLSWRWVFYVNIPIGLVTLAVAAAVIPATATRVHRVVDYLGTVCLSVAATSFILYTSLGGIHYAWGSPGMIALVVVGLVMTVAFVFVEHRAREPIIPMSLFRNRVYTATNGIGFVVGFAMFGALTFLPLFLQVVKDVSPTESGVQLFPLMGGLLVSSVISGRLITRYGRYKVFPVAGTALMTIGLVLLAHVDAATGAWVLAAFMAVFGVGMGLVMQVLIIAIQNAVPYETLGVATSNATFFRQIGGCFGTAIFGAIYANLLGRLLVERGIPARYAAATSDPTIVHHAPLPIQDAIITSVTHTVQTLFWVSVPIATVAFLLTFLLPEVPLRATVRTTARSGEATGEPKARTSLEEVERALERVANRENRAELYRTLAQRAGVELEPRTCWLLYRLHDRPDCTPDALSEGLRVPPEIIAPAIAELRGKGYVAAAGADGHGLALTDRADEAIEKLTAARRAGLTELLEGWDPAAHPELEELVRRLARELLADDEKLLADAQSGVRA